MTNAQIIAAITRWQTDSGLPPFTCGAHCQHGPLQATEREGQVILMCPDCEYWQAHIPAVVKRGGF